MTELISIKQDSQSTRLLMAGGISFFSESWESETNKTNDLHQKNKK